MDTERIEQHNPRSDEDLYTEAELAARLKVDPKTLYKLRRAGRIECYRVCSNVRYSEAQIQAYLESVREGQKVARMRRRA